MRMNRLCISAIAVGLAATACTSGKHAVSSDVLNASKDLLDECEHLDVDLQHVLDDNATLGALARGWIHCRTTRTPALTSSKAPIHCSVVPVIKLG